MGKDSGKQKTKSKPWAAQTPYLKDAFGQAQTTFNNSATPNADMNAAWNQTRNNSSDQTSGYNQSRGYYGNILANGGYDDGVFKNMAAHIIPSVTSQFMGSGRTGGGLEGVNLTDQLTQAYAPFATSQANMAASALPQLEGNQANALYNIGQQQYQYPWQNLNNYYGVVGGNNWGGQTTTSGGQPSMLQQGIGAGVGILGSALQGGMMGGPLGAVLGGAGGAASSIYNPTMAFTPYTA